MKKILIITLLVLWTLMGASEVKADEEKSMQEVEQTIVDHLQDASLIPRTEQYYNYIMNQLMFGEDESLASRDDYQEIITYMSAYINDVVLPDPNFSSLTIKDVISQDKKDDSFSSAKKIGVPVSVNPVEVKRYADRWWNDRNPEFQNWNPNNCANYVSQLLLAGGVNRTAPTPIPQTDVLETTDYWYSFHTPNNSTHKYEQSTSWIRVIDFFEYWRQSQLVIYPENLNVTRDLAIGDVVQLQPKAGGVFYHSMMVIDKDDTTIYLTGNSNDRQRMDIRDITDTNFRAIKFSSNIITPPIPMINDNHHVF